MAGRVAPAGGRGAGRAGGAGAVRRRWRWAALGLLLAAGAVGVALRQTGRAAAKPVAVPAAQESRPQAKGLAASAARPVATAVSAALAPAASIATAATAAASSPFVDVCGQGRVLRSELELREGQPPPAWFVSMEQQAPQAQAQVLKRLDAGTVKQRVAAALLREDVQAAAQLAAQTDDATAYRMALRACRKVQ